MTYLLTRLHSLTPPAARPFLSHALSLLAGAGTALMFHYLLYRIELPGKPFIYVAF